MYMYTFHPICERYPECSLQIGHNVGRWLSNWPEHSYIAHVSLCITLCLEACSQPVYMYDCVCSLYHDKCTVHTCMQYKPQSGLVNDQYKSCQCKTGPEKMGEGAFVPEWAHTVNFYLVIIY